MNLGLDREVTAVSRSVDGDPRVQCCFQVSKRIRVDVTLMLNRLQVLSTVSRTKLTTVTLTWIQWIAIFRSVCAIATYVLGVGTHGICLKIE